jgi:nascent polypeptide-associated complex subunit alpha
MTTEVIAEQEKQEVKIEDGSDTDSAGEDEEVPELEAQAQAQMAAAAGLPEELVSKAKQSRSEKKARKALSKLGGWQGDS